MAADESKVADATTCVNTIRVLAAETVQGAKSGHPGAPMGMAPMAHAVFGDILRFSPNDPKWANRDRFVLSNGHACALLYTMLHLTGQGLTMDDLKQFRQLGSKTPGHPESADTKGVEVTTGPLGQGIANAVGLAMAGAHLGAVFNRPGFELFDSYVYTFCGDGCLQEGVSGEAASLAGHLGLGRLIVLYDDNQISIDGGTELSFSEDVPKRFQAYGWHTLTVEAGDENPEAIRAAVLEAQKVTDRPSLISVKTVIGFGSARQGTAKVHGSPLGDEDLANVKAKFGADPEKKYHVPESVYAAYRAAGERGAAAQKEWEAQVAAYEAKFPAEGAELRRRLEGRLPEGWKERLPKYTADSKAEATRKSSGAVLNALAPVLPELVGGSADLTPSNNTWLECSHNFAKESYDGRYIRFGVREHAMAAIGNGLHAFGLLLPYTATFLNFIEYAYGAVRISALAHHQQIYVMTHDSIGLGEDGPTHQPVEALTLCRATPNMLTFRPADGNETAAAYAAALEHRNGPTVIALTRQNVPQLAGSSVDAALRGAYVAQEAADGKAPELILVGTGSEVSLCLAAAAAPALAGKAVRVVSMPCWELFDQQDAAYRRSVLAPGVPTVSVEALATTGWERYAHHTVGMTTFGASAPLAKVMDHFGFVPDKVADNAAAFLASSGAAAADLGVPAVGLLKAHL